MDVHDEFIEEETFADCVARLPQVCVELVLERDGQLLLALRTNEPAAGEWFWPGTRLYKGEELDAAAHRVADEELGVEVDLIDRLGVRAHFWDRSSVPGVEDRHTVNVVYHARPSEADPRIELDAQHRAYRWFETLPEDAHEYVREYVQRWDLPAEE